MKRVIMHGAVMVGVSSLLLLMGYVLKINSLMLYYYEETPASLTAGGSILPIVIGAMCCYLLDRIYYRQKVM
ncbi:hypothetical protein [Pontibacillus salipaludis]|uniref:hypothetical protein n=1 Tax=Pontibacillus salipaludis TaxID=1697394 RepID=UPI0031EC76B6